MPLRIIAGEARGRRLRIPEGAATRPTPDRVREALFSILGSRVREGGFLDLYAGSGAVGIEALSRGAPGALFVENDRRALEALRWNVGHCGLGDRATIVASGVLAALESGLPLAGNLATAYADPPYRSAEGAEVLRLLGEAEGPLAGIGLVVLEHGARSAPPPTGGRLEAFRTAVYGDTALTFYRPGGGV